MTYFLGKDVKVAVTTEGTGAISTSGTRVAGGAGNSFIQPLASGVEVLTTGMSDIVGVDLSPGSNDEDIKFFGINTILKAEVNKESVVTLTFKKNSNYWDAIFNNGARWGLNSADDDVDDGLTFPHVKVGYRVHIEVGSSEVFSFRNCSILSHTVTLTADGVQEETVEFCSQVDPVVGSAANEVATTLSLL